MQALTTIAARLIYGIPFIVFGVIHFLNARSMAGMVPSWIPGALFWVIVTGIALILGGVAISIKKVGRLASLLLALMLVIFILTIHIP